MDKFLKGYFYNPTRGNLKIKEVMEEMLSYMKEKPEKFYDIIVGCDSSSGEKFNFPVAVVILRVGEGGRFFLKKINYPPSLRKKFSNWKMRVLEEVLLSCELALFLRENFEKKIKSESNAFDKKPEGGRENWVFSRGGNREAESRPPEPQGSGELSEASPKGKRQPKAGEAKQPFNYQLRYIHADIGEHGQTRDMIKEVTGLIRGNGFEPKIKPESYVASTVADRYS
ncbi:hypothetical protein KJA16_00415 [Patescibacteria group bacterium]|nr:hypothetical protein [Patescibacteria group bacterium]